jgi:hypothetical protein
VEGACTHLNKGLKVLEVGMLVDDPRHGTPRASTESSKAESTERRHKAGHAGSLTPQ